MKSLIQLGSGSEAPAWMEDLDRSSFGEPWGSLAGHEMAWAFEREAFAIWSVIPAAYEAELLRVAVNQGLRRQGLGRHLLGACEAQMRRLGIRTLRLEVRVSNASARALYETLGWRPDGLRKAYYKDGEDAVLYHNELG